MPEISPHLFWLFTFEKPSHIRAPFSLLAPIRLKCAAHPHPDAKAIQQVELDEHFPLDHDVFSPGDQPSP